MTPDHQSSRRHFLAGQAFSLGGIALAWLAGNSTAEAKPSKPDLTAPKYDLTAKSPPGEPKARAMISMWMQGGPSHIDLFDPKPELNRLDGKKFPGKIKYDNAAQASAKVLGSPWKFKPRGECGMELSELVPRTAEIADDICLIRSMHTGVNNHGQSIMALNTGSTQNGRPVLGSWLTYALGAESQDLPAYVALVDPGQLPVLGVDNWANGFLPSLYQGTVVRPREPRILNLTAPAQLRGPAQQRYLQMLDKLNRRHLAERPAELDLAARIASYGLAARMQTAAKEAVDLSSETAHTRKLYGLDDPITADYGSRCLIVRRLVERGVRFVQVFTQNQFWDHHGSIRSSLPKSCRKVDGPAAALVQDLKQRGLLDSTLVHWGGEMGRLPVIQNDAGPAKIGRDHNTYGFSMWLAGGGIRGGMVHGATDPFGHKAVEDIVNHYDYLSTVMHLFGLNVDGVTYKRNGSDRKLVDSGRVVTEILA